MLTTNSPFSPADHIDLGIYVYYIYILLHIVCILNNHKQFYITKYNIPNIEQ